ncbi:hypothetical protein OA529_01435 [Alphaproteobacteria bacterium]|nr:hypothetical protein [Alphaproteobacteria bacterium]
MKQKSDINCSASNIISFKKYKDKKPNEVTSTIAAIIAIKIDHPSNTTPEDYFANQLDCIENIDVLAFEDALDNDTIGLTTLDAQNEASNDA